jgi:hypothetical protein
MALEDASKYAFPAIPPERGAEWVHHYLNGSVANLSAGTAEGKATFAYANYSRWVVDCPDCREGQLGCKTDHRFMCSNCGNVAIGGLWRTVDWPDEAPEVEAALEVRPPDNQNWFPEETVQDLITETADQAGETP